MPPQIQADQATEPVTAPERPSPMSRRSLLRGAAGAGAVAVAAAAGAGGVVALTRERTQTAPPTAKPVAMAAMPHNALAGPLVVYLADTANGEMDVFAGTGQIRLRNPALVGQLLRNLQMAQ